MLIKMNRRQAYFAVLKFHFHSFLMAHAGECDRMFLLQAWSISKRRAAEYAFQVKTVELETVPVW